MSTIDEVFEALVGDTQVRISDTEKSTIAINLASSHPSWAPILYHGDLDQSYIIDKTNNRFIINKGKHGNFYDQDKCTKHMHLEGTIPRLLSYAVSEGWSVFESEAIEEFVERTEKEPLKKFSLMNQLYQKYGRGDTARIIGADVTDSYKEK